MCIKCDSFRALVEGLEASGNVTASTLGFLLKTYTGPDDISKEEEKASIDRAAQKLDTLTPEQRTEVLKFALETSEYFDHIANNIAHYKAAAHDTDLPMIFGVAVSVAEAAPETLMGPKPVQGMVS